MVLRDEESDAIRQIWNPWDGLTEVLPREDASGYTISSYLPAQVTPPAQDAESPLYAVSGNPFRTVSVVVDATVSSLTVTEHDAEQPESMPDVITCWSFVGGTWSRSSGSGDALITESRTRTDVTTYTRDAAGRVLTTRRDIGAMTTTESMVYDILGRLTSRTDTLGRVTTTAYSADGLTSTLTTPAGATLITTRNRDGSVAHLYGTGQRELYYVYDTSGNNARETVKQTLALSSSPRRRIHPSRRWPTVLRN